MTDEQWGLSNLPQHRISLAMKKQALAGIGQVARRTYEMPLDEEGAIRHHLPLLHAVVNRMHASLPEHVEINDLVSAGLVGLVHAYRKFDSTMGVPFATYASGRIRGAILDELRHLDWMSRAARSKAKLVAEVITSFEQAHGRPSSEEEIANELGLTQAGYAELLDEVKPIRFVELDSSPQSDDADSMHEIVPDARAISADLTTQKQEMIKLVVERLQKMPETSRKVLAMYYFEDMRLSEIATIFGVTESRICQIHTHAVLSLRTYLQSLTV